jgi:predicted RND superfamily exporter protein
MSSLRIRLEHGFERLGRLIFRHKYVTLLLVLAAVAADLYSLPRLRFDTSNESYFREDDPTLANYDRFREQFGREEVMIIAITPPNVFDTAFLEKLTAFHKALESELPYLDDVTSLVNVRDTRGEADELIVEDLLKEIPRTPAEIEAFKRRVLNSELYRNYLVSEDGRMTAVVAQTLAFSPAGGEDEDLLEGFGPQASAAETRPNGKRLPLTVEENRAFVNAAEAIASRFDGPDFPVHIGGGPAINDFFERTMQRDMGTFLGLAVLTICGFLFILFRRITGVVMPLAVVLLSLICTIGVMAWADVPFTIPTTILPSFLLATGVGAVVHFLAIFYLHYSEIGDKEESVVYTMGHSGLPIVFTSLTTAAGLFSFATAQMAPVAHMGIFGGIGTMLSLVFTLVLLPALIALFPVRRYAFVGSKQPSARFDRFLIRIADFATGRAWAVVGFSAAIAIVSVAGLIWLRFSMDFLSWFPKEDPLRMTSELLNEEMKGSINLEIVVDTGTENGLYDPAVLNGIQDLADYAQSVPGLNGRPLVGKSNSVLDVVKETHRALNENRPVYYAIPQDRQLVAQELLLFENSGSDDLEQLVDTKFSKARMSLLVPNRDAATYVEFVSDIRREADQRLGGLATVDVTGTLNLFSNMIHNMMLSMAQSYLYSGIAITLMMIALVGSLRMGLLSMIPNFSPILITLGLIMGFNGIALDAFNLTLGSIALGLAVDDTIHFFHNFRRYYAEHQDCQEAVRKTLLSTGRAMLFTSLVLVTGFFVFMFATLNNVYYFGLLTGVTLIFALLADFFLSPALLELVTRTAYGRKLAAGWAGAKA